MKRRDPETRQQQILEAALVEFAAHGKAGARVERIAAGAGCSVGLLYAHFGNKEQLFDALYDDIVARSLEGLPIDAADLPGYALRLYDGQSAYPEVMRVSLWHLLQDGGDRAVASVTRAAHDKIAAIEAAQREGTIAKRLTAPQLLLLTLAIASMWSTLSAELTAVVPAPDTRRETIAAAVRALAEP